MNTEQQSNIEYGKRLRKQRIHLNLTQEQVAEKIGLSDRQYRRYENAESVMTSKCLTPLCLEGFDINYIIG